MSTFDVKNTTQLWSLLLLLTLVAAIPRFYGLGDLGFYGDEETTALPALAYSETGEAVMPSGMPYHRALPHTWLNAMFASWFGANKEISYRLTSAILGSLTIPLLFILARPFFGIGVALTAALLLAFSEWHILTSREARMYAPFLFFYIASGLSMWQWLVSNRHRYLILSILLFLISISLQALGIFLIGFLGIALLFKDWAKPSAMKIITYLILAAITSLSYFKYFVNAPYDEWRQALGGVLTANPAKFDMESPLKELITQLSSFSYIFALVGLASGLWLVVTLYRYDKADKLSLQSYIGYGLLVVSSLLLSTANLYAAIFSILPFMYMQTERLRRLIKQGKKPLLLIAGTTLIALAANSYKLGIVAAIKQSISVPYPYLSYYFFLSIGLFACFIVACVLLLRPRQPTAVKAVVLITLLPLAAIAMEVKWGGIRYIIQTYPFFLLAAAFGLTQISKFTVERLKIRGYYAYALTLVIVLSGVLGGHGIPQAISAATMTYGDSSRTFALGFPVYPDHKGAGEYVRSQLQDNDIVIAEDMLQQKWYVKQVDYWLRDFDRAAGFLYKSKDNHFRDIYVSSIIITPDILASINAIKDQRIWIITSGETTYSRSANLNAWQEAWLVDIELQNKPKFVGRDAVTRVYCLNCDN